MRQTLAMDVFREVAKHSVVLRVQISRSPENLVKTLKKHTVAARCWYISRALFV